MIDLHTHILAGIDDGAKTLDDSIALITDAVNGGVTKILSTPHIHFGCFDNNIASIKGAFSELTAQLEKQPLAVSVAYAAEVHLCPEILLLAKQKQLPFMGKWQAMDILLLEFPGRFIPPGSEKLVDWLIKQGIKPMIAHPERDRDLHQFSELVRLMEARDCLFQVTAGSLLGDFGERAASFSWQLVEENRATIVASDMHHLVKRPCKMQQAYDAVLTRCGKEVAERLFVINPEIIFDSNPTCWTAP